MVKSNPTLWDTFRWSKQDEVSRAVIQLERNGFAIDTEYCATAAQRAREDEVVVKDKLYEFATGMGLSESKERIDEIWSSPAKIIKVFHELWDLPPSPVKFKGRVNLAAGQRSVDVRAVEWIAAHVEDQDVRRGLNLLLDLRKIWSSVKYLEKFPRFVGPDGLVHPICGPAGDDDEATGPVTWRLAYKKPEGQQIPKSKRKDKYGVRRAIIPAPAVVGGDRAGRVLVSNDYSALEVVLLAHLCAKLFGDYSLAESLSPDAPDFHSSNAREVFGRHLHWTVPEEYGTSLLAAPGMPVESFGLSAFKNPGEETLEHPYAVWLRDIVKTVWYGLQYRKGTFGFGWTLQDSAGDPIGERAAADIVAALYATVPALQNFHHVIDQRVLADRGVAGLNGAWCDLHDLVESGDKWSIARAQRRGSNYPMQEGGAACMGPAMVNVLRNRDLQRMGYVLRMQVHDQLVGDVDGRHANEAAEVVQYEMENAFPLLVKLRASKAKGANLYECKDFN